MARRDKSSAADVTDWHRLFGIVLTELFEGSDWEVIRELDLSIKKQQLDIVIVRRRHGDKTPVLPDGLGPLADHNLITYKSLHEPLDGWALKELVGHSVNYRNQVSPSLDRLLPEESIRLFAIATRFPDKLAGKIALQTVESGVYDVAWGTDTIRLLVLNQIPAADRNAILNLFSAEPNRILAGVTRVSGAFSELSTVLTDLIKRYHGELNMPQTLQVMIRISERRVLADISPALVAEEWSLEKLREMQTVVAQRIAKLEKKQPAAAPATKGRRKPESARS